MNGMERLRLAFRDLVNLYFVSRPVSIRKQLSGLE